MLRRLAPASVLWKWARETTKWIPKAIVSVLHGDGGSPYADVMITTYGTLDKWAGYVEMVETRSDIEPLRTAIMQNLNAGKFSPDSSMTLADSVERVYLPWVQAERRTSTYKGYRESGRSTS